MKKLREKFRERVNRPMQKFFNRNQIKYVLLVAFFLCIILLLTSNISFASDEAFNETNAVKSIRSTGNTDISNRTGKIFYVSSSGNDDNDGLSKEKPWKTLQKINNGFSDNTISKGDTILLKRGDTFRGNIEVKNYDILIGSYGDEKLNKPEILGSPYDGAKDGEWTEVEKNIWKYTVDGKNPFTSDVGAIWFISDKNDLPNTMPNVSGSFEYAQKITTNKDVDESQIKLTELLKNDLEFYHFGRAYHNNDTGTELYLYSTENPKDRFKRIEFNICKNAIAGGNYTNLQVDNISVKFAGAGIGARTIANFKVTNCEVGFIGGCMLFYDSTTHEPIRYGNAVDIYGEVKETNGYKVEDGFTVDNNYIYQVYDSGISWQYEAMHTAKIEKAVFQNNVVEYCNWNIEYWIYSISSDEAEQQNTYINNFYIKNNILKNSGKGICETRPDKNTSTFIRTYIGRLYTSKVVGELIIENNLFDTASDKVISIYAGTKDSLPQIKNNVFYNSKDIPFGYYFDHSQKKQLIDYDKEQLIQEFPTNKFYYDTDKVAENTNSGNNDSNNSENKSDNNTSSNTDKNNSNSDNNKSNNETNKNENNNSNNSNATGDNDNNNSNSNNNESDSNTNTNTSENSEKNNNDDTNNSNNTSNIDDKESSTENNNEEISKENNDESYNKIDNKETNNNSKANDSDSTNNKDNEMNNSYSDNTKNKNNKTIANSNNSKINSNLNKDTEKNTINYIQTSINTSTANTSIPKTGENTRSLFYAILGSMIIAIISFVGIKRN